MDSLQRLQRIWRPTAFQGVGVDRRYFEGWYFKNVDAAQERTVALIPGVSFSKDGSSSHAFVQFVPSFGEAHYFSYPSDALTWDDKLRFGISVGPNVFDRGGITLDLHDGEREIRGRIDFGPWSEWPVKALSPGAMGWYRFVPGMETYHAVVSMDHSVTGSLSIDGESFSLGQGRGYAEKDWGHSFPSSWIWMQSNSFDETETSFFMSVARIPWMGNSFVGHLAGILHKGELHRFTTYTGSKLRIVETNHNEAHVVIADKQFELEVHARGSKALVLKAPILGAMEGHDSESLGGTIDVTLRSLTDGDPRTIFKGTGRMAGIEVMNKDGALTRTQ